ncbi:type I restriction-modification system, DNA-methyltransferase subunit M [Pseudanabaena sp. lw0831]|uniref:N-6 DNA methylase n=1 Tax=Pseudanabaena sp. lw0831 TaxID=1357935 RepID=UPI001916339B|nr:type I restriction-modification system subunit M/S [Pseudanabaena sp. lw0831]GBO53054.1 type I restriction-modification system, DNA-methyltransferase subunit M [Pseudanabaena sp. lw0831]
MEVESTANIQYIQSQLWHFADVARNSGRSVEDSILDAFTVLLASRTIKNSYLKAEFHENIPPISEVVYEFVRSICSPYYEKTGFPVINFEHPALHRLLYFCNSNEVSDSDLIDILNWIVGHSNIQLAESSTPTDLADLLINIANVKSEESILDPAMGTAGILRALRRAENHKSVFQGIEINIKYLHLACLYKYLLHDSHSLLSLGNAFWHYSKSNITPVDIVICNPPVQRIPLAEARNRYGLSLCSPYVSSEMALNFVELGLKNLKSGGRAVFLINMKPLFALGELEQIRKYWIESGLLKSVVSLPSNLLAHTGLKCAILVFHERSGGSTNDSKQVKFIKADDCFIEEKKGRRILGIENINEITKRVIHINDGVIAKEVGVSEIAANNFSLIPDQYLNQHISGINLRLSKIWKPLGEIAEILRGSSFSKLKSGCDPIIQGRDLRVEKLKLNDLECKDLSEYINPIQRTQAFDILLQRIGEKPAAYFVTTEEGYAVADTVFIIRFKDTEPAMINFISQFINSEEGAEKIKEATSYMAVQTKSLKIIKEIKVPVPDIRVVDLVQEMNKIESALRTEYEKAAQLRKSIFGGFDEVDLSTNLRKVRLTSQVLKNALSQKDDINYKVKSLYPFPLAYPYRNIYLEKEYAARYDRQMKYGEHLLSFLASVGMSLIFEYREQINQPLDSVVSLINSGLSSGLSPGHWRNLLQESCNILRNLEDTPLADDFSSIWFKGRGKKESEFAKNTLQCIVQKLNDFKHGRGPVNTYEYKVFGEKQSNDIDNLLEDLDFISQCELVLIDDIDTDWATGKTIYKGSLLKGDHPAYERVTFGANKSLSKEKLYIHYNTEFISLYPFLSLLYNPDTKKIEIFSFDKQVNESLALKSFDSGTSIKSEQVYQDLSHWLNFIS